MILLLFHGPEVFDSGWAARLLEALRPLVPLRPVLAGATPFMLGVAIGFGDPGGSGLTAADSLAWEQQERALLLPTMSGDWYE